MEIVKSSITSAQMSQSKLNIQCKQSNEIIEFMIPVFVHIFCIFSMMDFICCKCFGSFNFSNEAINHLKTMHDIIERKKTEMQCIVNNSNECDKTVRTFNAIRNHLEKRSGKYKKVKLNHPKKRRLLTLLSNKFITAILLVNYIYHWARIQSKCGSKRECREKHWEANQNKRRKEIGAEQAWKHTFESILY